MRRLVDVTNIKTPDANNPKGSMQDKSTGILGTILGETLFGDIVQFFQKLVINSGITENDAPDNVTNGYQLLEAAEISIGSVFTAYISSAGSIVKKRGLGSFTFTKQSTGYYKIDELTVSNYQDYAIQITPIYNHDSGSSPVPISGNIDFVSEDNFEYAAVRITNSSNVVIDSEFYITITKL